MFVFPRNIFIFVQKLFLNSRVTYVKCPSLWAHKFFICLQPCNQNKGKDITHRKMTPFSNPLNRNLTSGVTIILIFSIIDQFCQLCTVSYFMRLLLLYIIFLFCSIFHLFCYFCMNQVFFIILLISCVSFFIIYFIFILQWLIKKLQLASLIYQLP